MAWPKQAFRPPIHGSHGLGQGAGWGGPAKGARASRIKPGDPDGIRTMRNDPAVKARKAARAAEMEDVLYGIALRGEQEMARINAATRLHAIYEGMPIARTVTATVSDPSQLTDADLAAIATGGREPAAEAPSGPAELLGVVH